MKRAPVLVAAGCAALLFALGSSFMDLAGLGHDEAMHAQTALSVAGAPSQPRSYWPYMPLMRDEYNGPLKTYALLPAFAALGAQPGTLRLTTLAVGALTLLLLVLLVVELEGTATGLLFGLLFACDPALVFTSVFDIGPSIVMAFFKTAGLLLLLRAWRSGGLATALAGGLALGFAWWDKAHGVWLLAALPAAAAPFVPAARRRAALRPALAAAAGALAGALPFLLHNLLRPAISYRFQARSGWSLSTHLPAAWTFAGERARSLAAAFSGRQQFPGPDDGTSASAAIPVLLLLGAALAVLAVRRRDHPALRRAAFWLTLTALVLAAAILTPAPVKWHHLFLAYPFPHLALAALAGSALRRASPKGLAPAAAAALALCAALNLRALGGYRAALLRSGALPQFFEGAERASDWVEGYALRHPSAAVFVDDDLEGRFALYTGGRVPIRPMPSHVFGALEQGDCPACPQLAADLSAAPDTIVLAFLREGGTSLDALERIGVKAGVIREFPRGGAPWAAVYRIKTPTRGRRTAVAKRYVPPPPARGPLSAPAAPLGKAGLRALEGDCGALSESEAASGPDLLALASLAARCGKNEAAAGFARRGALESPDDPSAWLELGAALVRLGRGAEAAEALKRAAPLAKSSGQRRRLAQLMPDAGLRGEALALLDGLIRESPSDASLRADRGLARFQDGAAAAAVEDLEEAVRLEPRALPAYLTLGAIYEGQGRGEKARELYGRALALEPLPEHRALRERIKAAQKR